MLKHVGLPVGIRRRSTRPTLRATAQRAWDKSFTSAQEWLEGPDTRRMKTLAVGTISLFILYVAGQIIRAVLLR